MIRDIEKISTSDYDLVVVGGGIFGACVAWEAASRGLSVALLERGDFAHATSSNSYKIAHGGIRYLQHGDIVRVRRSSHERSALIRVAPHLVYPVPILVPTYGRGTKGKLVLRAGFGLYDLLTWDRNRGITDPSRTLSRARFLGRDQALAEFSELPAAGLTGGAVFEDGQMYSPPRLVLSFVRAAAEHGASVANYAEVTDFMREGNRVCGVEVDDLLGGRSFSVRAQTVVNTAGPWAAQLLESRLGLELGQRRPSFSRDVGLVVDRQLHGKLGLACQTVTRDAEAVLDRGGRHLFFLPWRDRTLVGVWHGAYRGAPDEVEVTTEELRSFIADANQAYPGLDLRMEDVGLVITGLILFGDEDDRDEQHAFGRRSLIWDHEREDGLKGLFTVVGVRATVARGVAERTVNQAARHLSQPVMESRTADTPIFGGDFQTFTGLLQKIADAAPDHSLGVRRALAHNYGSRFRDVLQVAHETPSLAQPLPGSHVLGAEVIHAVREEAAYTLEDVVLRRTDLGTAGNPGLPALRKTARLMASELGWEDERAASEVADLKAFYRTSGARRAFEPDPHESVES